MVSIPERWRRFRADSGRQAVAARLLWLILAVVVWNVVFDRVLVLAGRRYVHAAATAFEAGQPPVLVDPWMTTAQRRGVRLATAAALPIAVVGVAAVHLASRRRR
jgi:hypothetical protein